MKNLIQGFEAWFDQQSTQKRLVYAGFALLSLAILAINYLYPMAADDFLYSAVKHGESFSLVKSLSDIVSFMHYYYFNWGGRMVGIGAVHILLLFPPLVQDVLNTGIFISLIYFLYKITNRGQRSNFFLFVLLAVSVFYFTPSFLSSAIWLTGSSVFLLPATLSVAFIYTFYRFYNGETTEDSKPRMVAFFFFGMFAGWSNEITGPLFCLVLAIYIFMLYLNKKESLPYWVIIGFIGAIIGCALMIFAPGNSVRLESEGMTPLLSFAEKFNSRIMQIEGCYRYFMLKPIIIYVVCILLQFFFPKNEDKRKILFIQSLIFFIVANIGIWMILFTPTFPPRAFLIITVLTVISVGILYANIDFKRMCPKILNIVFLATLLFFAAKDYTMFFRGLLFLDKEIRPREAIIAKAKAEGKNDVYFRKIMLNYRFEYTDFSHFNKEYYGVNIHFVEEDDPILEENYDK